MCAHLPPGLATLSHDNETPLDIARRSNCSADILQVFSSSPLAVEKLSYDEFWGVHKYVVASNELHELYAGPADRFHEVFDLDDGVLKLLQEEIDERGRTPLHILAGNAQAYTHVLAEVGVQSICFNDEALTKQDNKGETPIDIARRSGACAEIIGLLSLTPEEARSFGWSQRFRDLVREGRVKGKVQVVVL